jgi:hypothetical protein
MIEKINQNTIQTNTTLPIAGSDNTKELMTTWKKTRKISNPSYTIPDSHRHQFRTLFSLLCS